MPAVPDRYRLPLLLTFASLIVLGLLILLVRASAPRDEIVIVRPTPSPTPSVLLVHVSGAVAAPGVYQLEPGSRVADALSAAAGPAPDADTNLINLAAFVEDGQQISVPRRTAAQGPTGTSRERMNLNRATAADLDALPGIGPVFSSRIVEYREQNGPFKSLEDLRDAKLIPGATFDRIKDLITVE